MASVDFAEQLGAVFSHVHYSRLRYKFPQYVDNRSPESINAHIEI